MKVDKNTIQTRITCVIEASKLKQNPTTAKEYTDKSVIDIAKEFEKFVLR